MTTTRVLLSALALATFGLLGPFDRCMAAGQPPHEHEHGSGQAETLGTVDFPVSCNAPARETFGRAVALLHSFWYDEAEKAFVEVTRLDRVCAMGHWGVAMSLFHPVWAAANPAAGPTPAELARGRESERMARELRSKTERERDFIAAVTAFYEPPDGTDYAVRAAAFEKGMAEVYRKNPNDREAGVFYALALLGTAPPGDKSYAKQKAAAEILNRFLPGAPEHPGIAHYLIHSFDYPQLASLALPAARAYSKIAASSPHALHMPSHIFTRLALWDDSVRSNLASAEAARRHAAKAQPGASSFDQLHAIDYLAYAYLQQAQDDKARAVLEEAAKVDKLDVPNFAAAYALAAVPARFALERRSWPEAAALTVRPASFPWDRFPYAEALIQFARAIGGARSANLAVAREAVARLEVIRDGRKAARDGFWADQVEIQRLAGAAWLERAQDHVDEAVKLMRAAADLEDTTEKHPVTPGSVLPARELLGDMLLGLSEPGRALAEYEASLASAPGRFNGLLGAARAAERGGRQDKARSFYSQLLKLGAQAEGRKGELAEARAYLNRTS